MTPFPAALLLALASLLATGAAHAELELEPCVLAGSLGVGSVNKFFRSDGNRRNTLDFKPYSVVQTARRA